MKKTIFLILIIMSVSCGPSLYQHNQTEIEKAKDHWIGGSKQELILSWGPPDSISNDEYTGEILTYRRNTGYIVWVTNFFINEHGIIYHLNAYSQ